MTSSATKLNSKQQAFCEYFTLGGELDGITTLGNATRAYMKAYECKESTARAEGCKALAKPNISQHIATLLQQKAEQRDERLTEKSNHVLAETEAIAHSNIVQTVAGEFNSLAAMHEAITKQSPDTTSAVQELTFTENYNEKTGGTTVRLRVKLFDKLAALKMLASFYGMDNPFHQARRILKQHGIAMVPDEKAECGWRLEVHEVKGVVG